MAATAKVSCWRGTSTTTWSDVATSRTLAVAAMTTASRPRNSVCLSACGSLRSKVTTHECHTRRGRSRGVLVADATNF